MSTQRDRWEFIYLFMKHATMQPGETEGDLNRKALKLLRYAATHRRIEIDLANAAYRKHADTCASLPLGLGWRCNCTMIEDKEATARAIAKRDRIDAKMEAIAPIVYGALTVSVRMGDREVYIP